MSAGLVCAVDVGTGSARAGVLDRAGRLLGRGEHPIALHRPRADHAEHDSRDIWRAVCAAVRQAIAAAGAMPGDIAGIGFDATCSLVVLDAQGQPLPVSVTGDGRWDTIVWLDHRAIAEADECTATAHPVLAPIGGVMSPEMQTPKMMWLKRNLPDVWAEAGLLFDLADWLTFMATDSLARSQCTLACKWTYQPHKGGWRRDFFARVGLDDMLAHAAMPDVATDPGADLGPLTAEAADALGLTSACRVATGLIDAYAGALGVLGGLPGPERERHLALIAGTSSCIMAMTAEPLAMTGGWGPYLGVGLPELWMTEAGQSATGALLDHVIRWHGAGGEPDAARHAAVVKRVMELRASEGVDLAGRLHVLPDFHGNRSPFADPHALGVISGLSLDSSFDSLARHYWRTCVGIALGVRHILDTLREAGQPVDTLHVTGGHTRNALLMELYADACGVAIAESPTADAMLLGSAMSAASAAGLYPDLAAACAAMRPATSLRQPNPAHRARFDRDYRIFLAMHRQRRDLERL